MQSQKAQKIDLSVDYPCPCRRKGRLVPIVLTEALGCDRCQQIFVVEDNGYAIEQLSTAYPYKKSWHWTGNQWKIAHSGLRESYLPVALAIILVPLFVWLPLALRLPIKPNILLWALVPLLLLLLLAIYQWLAYRRSPR